MRTIPWSGSPAFHRCRRALAALGALATGSLGAAPTLETLVEFPQGPGGPRATLTKGRDGNFYGPTAIGGAKALGTIVRITPAGAVSVLVDFTGTGPVNRGSTPTAALALASDGNFYGVTSGGGALGFGTVFKMSPAGVLVTLAEFTGNGATNRGAQPMSIMQASDGNFYGTTYRGTAPFGPTYGTIFRMSPAGELTTLVEFTRDGAANRGAYPSGALVEGADGNLYGATSAGGTLGYGGGGFGYGTIFRMSPTGALTTLVDFANGGAVNRGAGPNGLCAGSDGFYYGTTAGGGGGSGTVFRVTPAGALTTLAEFTGATGERRGAGPSAALVAGPDGSFYGTTEYGGPTSGGTAFRVTPAGEFVTLADFTPNISIDRGLHPTAGLTLGDDGAFYGVTREAGYYTLGNGTFFRVTADGVVSTRAVFTRNGYGLQGANPVAALVAARDGHLYGSTQQGGPVEQGTLFRISLAGELTTLVQFDNSNAAPRGASPAAALTEGRDGNLYGTTYGGGHGAGTIFRLTPQGSFTTLVEFTRNGASNRGAFPSAPLIEDSDGSFYGTTEAGGPINTQDFGTVFRMTPDGILTTLVSFTRDDATNAGWMPKAALVKGRDGNFYGTTSDGGQGDAGTVFQMTPGGSLATLVHFSPNFPPNPGASPVTALLEDADGSFFGSTQSYPGAGMIFKVSPAGALAPLFIFSGTGTGGNRGAFPSGDLLRGPDGNLYGTTTNTATQPANTVGTIFRMTPAGALTTLVEFTGSSGPNLGYAPRAGLVLARDGNLYGTTYTGGAANFGTVFRLRFGPTPRTLAATGIGATEATLNGTFNPNGAAATAWFEYGAAPDALVFSTRARATGNGTIPVTTQATLTGLTPGTPCYYRLRSESGEQFQAQFGEVLSFVPAATQPSSTALVSVSANPGVGTLVRWRGIPGRSYQAQFVATLGGAWQNASGTLAADAAGMIEYRDAAAPTPAERFFRILLLP